MRISLESSAECSANKIKVCLHLCAPEAQIASCVRPSKCVGGDSDAAKSFKLLTGAPIVLLCLRITQ